jgi:hypothetical protein
MVMIFILSYQSSVIRKLPQNCCPQNNSLQSKPQKIAAPVLDHVDEGFLKVIKLTEPEP